MLLNFTPTPDLSLFLTKESCLSYSLIHSCLFSFLIVKDRLKECWIKLGRRERDRRRWEKETDIQLKVLNRTIWETRRMMNWWIDEMILHFWNNVINLNLNQFFHQLKSIESSLNFKSLAILHSHFLFKISFGLCLFEFNLLNSLLKKCLKLCDELDSSEFEFELFPPLLLNSIEDHHHHHHHQNQESNQLKLKLKQVYDLGIEFKLELKEFFKSLSKINHQPEKGTILGSNTINQTIDHSTIIMGGIGGSIPGWLESLGEVDEEDEVLRESKLEVSVFKRTVVNQLLSKLDFSGFFSDRRCDEEDFENVLDGL
ncbi:hypothetical protein DFH28DRAFT_899932 [Melampsora americana]|nr:hypothetical protein DFH28DRAFT_899932 [Melampsora americana]